MRTVLVSAYGCEPGLGSEQGVGWNWVLQMAKNNKVYVITRANNRNKIEGNIPNEVIENIDFHYFDTPPIIKNLKKRAKGLYFYYFFWQVGIIPLVRRLIKQHKPDYTMHLTFGSMWMPTFLPFFRVPFIWGPIGGGDCEPISFFKVLPLKQRLQAYLRLLMNLTIPVNPFIMFICHRASAILCRTKSSREVLPNRYNRKKYIILETAIEDIANNDQTVHNDQTISLISTGRLMPSKNIISAIRALGGLFVDNFQIKYTIIGSGSEKHNIEKEVKRLGIENCVEMISETSRQEVLNKLLHADIFIFPSLREGGSWALMEGMAAKLPVICLNCSGMQVITEDSCAIRLPITNPEQMPKDMADAIIKLIENPELRKLMGEAGRERIRTHFNWESKGKFMESLFDKLEQESIDVQ